MLDTWNGRLILCCVLVGLMIIDRGTAVNRRSTTDLMRDVEQHKYVLVLFVNGDKEINKKAEGELDHLQTPDLYDQEVLKVTCSDQTLAVSVGVNSFPRLILYRSQVPVLYDGELTAPAIQVWIEQAREVNLQSLDDTSFEHLTQASTGATTGVWLVIFYKDSCKEKLPAIEGTGVLVRQKMNVAQVNIDESPETAKRFNIKDCPVTYFFRHGKMYQYISDKSDMYRVKSLVSFVMSWYNNVEGAKVPTIPTAFDQLTESIADYLKDKLQNPQGGNFLLIGGAVLAVVAFVLAIVVATCSKNAKKTIKED
ncbi:thioredoxin domain-containing protein-like isoform X2 [Ostrea edulis]|uniref:thioredoxin domain-containing protein-like isoform X2 n=1 Tax=Ostrea edulis TaxID=37623 RepID=UPI0024AECA56|nr:thioredoxin domain-containing protein-like isoform X2 [Ostrea edulis]